MFEDQKFFWTFDGTTIEEWSVLSRTRATFKVESANTNFKWKRTVMASAVGKKFHLTPRDAMAARIGELQREIEYLKQRLHIRRTALGMVQSLLKRVEEPPSVAPVDPSAADPGTLPTREKSS